MGRKTKKKQGTADEGKAGNTALDLDSIVDVRTYRRGDETITENVTLLDRACEILRYGGFDKDVAARVGVARETISRWNRRGTRCLVDLNDGSKRYNDLSEADRQAVRYVTETSKAEAEGKQFLLGLAERLSAGGITVETVTEKVDADGKILERSTKREHTLPDGQMIRWRLERRWPDDYGRSRVEISGPDGAPVQLEASTALDRALADLARIPDPTEQADSPQTNNGVASP